MLGDNIKKLRSAKKLSLRRLAQRSGLALGYLSDLENNKATNPSLETLQKLADALEAPRGLLLEDDTSIENVTEEVYKVSEFGGELNGMSDKEKRDMIKEILAKEPGIYYELDPETQKSLSKHARQDENHIITLAANRTDGYDDDLPAEAKEELKNFIEYLKVKYKKKG